MLKVSVIIPCYNHGQYLDEAVDSIVHQTFQDFEVIVVNDGSTDELTIEKLKHYDKPKTMVLHITNQGLAAARNNGIRKAQGEYILPLDADDYFESTFLEKAVSILDNQPEVGVVSCGIRYFGFSNRTVMPKGGDVRVCLAKSGVIGNSMFRKLCWEQASGYNEHIEAYEDWDFWLRVTKRGWLIHVIREYLFNYRQHPVSMRIEARSIRPLLVKQLVQNHRAIFEKYVDEAIFEREKKIFTLAQKKKDLLNSPDYKIGNCLLSPFRLVKRIFNKSTADYPDFTDS
jgi:glycosyltransferase involved in cell wall biosynthesis